MSVPPRKISLEEWDLRFRELHQSGFRPAAYGGPLRRHLNHDGDLRLRELQFDNSAACLRLWNFVLSENDRLREAKANGEVIVGTMKDLGTIPVLASAFPRLRAFYPDATWWTPCLMECSDGLLEQAGALGLDPSLCPVRAMVPAFLNQEHFPRPDLVICSTGAVCDDFAAVAQRLEALGFPILWWEMPRRRAPEPGEWACRLPGNLSAPQAQADWVGLELARVGEALGAAVGIDLSTAALQEAIQRANHVRRLLEALRQTTYQGQGGVLPSLEMLLAEMLALHFCSDQPECIGILEALLSEATSRLHHRQFVIREESIRVFWVNPVADLRAMNRLEELGGRICGTDYMFTHALDLIAEDLPPLQALARTALADPMAGPTQDRARRVVQDCRTAQAEAVIVSRIPGASHCAREGELIRDTVQRELQIPTIELEIPPLCDAMFPTLSSRIEALIETATARRQP